MSIERPAQRFGASSFPQIEELRLLGTAVTLVNLSSSGILVECSERSVPGALLTLEFVGTFTPATVQGRVIRCEVVGISPSGSMRYRIGLAFLKPIVLPKEGPAAAAQAPVPSGAAPAQGPAPAQGAAPVPAKAKAKAVPASPPAAASGPAPKATRVLRNRW
jgi:hypothetical protein